MKGVLRWCWSATKTTGRAIDSLVFADWILARRTNSQIEAELDQLEATSIDSWSGDPRALRSPEILRETYDRELGYRSELVSKTHQLINAAGLVVMLVTAGTVVTISMADGSSDYRLAAIGFLAVAMFYFLLSWRMILDATAPAKVFYFSVEDAARGDDEKTTILRAVEGNRRVTNLILIRSSVARSSMWRALIWASTALAVAVMVAFVGPEAGSGESDAEQVEARSEADAAADSLDRPVK